MLLIAFGSRARQGKDLAGEAIVNYYQAQRDLQARHGLKVTAPVARVFKFAEALYEECRTLHGMTIKDAPLLQRVGAERRAEDPDYWIDRVFKQISSVQPDIAILTDLRYQNEAGAVKLAGGWTVEVIRVKNGDRVIADDRDPTHPSETELDLYPFDFTLVNSEGHQAFLGEQAITLSEYLLGLEKR